MKKLNLLAVLTAIITTLTFSSCLNGSTSENFDYTWEYVTVKKINGATYLVGDFDNIKFRPLASSVISSLIYKGDYYERVVVGIKLADGERMPKNGETCNIKEIALRGALPYQSMTTRPDTLSGDYSFVSIAPQDNYGGIWAGNGFINVPMNYYKDITTDKMWNLQLYVEAAKEDTLYTRLRKTSEKGKNAYPTADFISYKIPNDNSDFMESIYKLQPKSGDSIVIKVSAIDDNKKMLSKSTKVSLSKLIY